jgi:hypothetical protein
MTGVHEWFASQVLQSHAKGDIPHGSKLPETMPWVGDFFVVNNDDGSDTLWTYWGCDTWHEGPRLKRPEASE